MSRARAARSRGILTQSILAVAILGLGTARAAESTRLSYLRGSGAEECPDERALRLAVAVRLGYDPFVAWAKTTIHAQVARDGSKLRARVDLAGEDGKVRGSRELVGSLDECDKLIAAMSLAISIAIDPMSVNASSAQPSAFNRSDESLGETAVQSTAMPPHGSSAAPDDAPGAERDKIASKAPAPAQTPRRAALFEWYAGLGALVATGVAPDVSTGGAAFAQLRAGPASVGLEARYDLPASAGATRGSGAVQSSLFLLSLEPCLRFQPLALCGLASIGSLRGSGSGVSVPLQQSALYAAAGGRAAFELPISGPLSLRLHADLIGNLTRVRLTIDGEDVWRAPAFAAIGGFDAVARIW